MDSDNLGIAVRDSFKEFISKFKVDDNGSALPNDSSLQGHSIYLDQIDLMKRDERTTHYVDFTHILDYDQVLFEAIERNYYRLIPFLSQGLTNVIKERLPDFGATDRINKQFHVSFYNVPATLRLRDLKSQLVGKLVAISGTVTRSSEVQPELQTATFVCKLCNTILNNVEQQFRYTEPNICPIPICNNRSKWKLILESSIFIDWQKIRIQENTGEIPPGAMPRSMDVILHHESVEKAKAGDRCIFTGYLAVVPEAASKNHDRIGHKTRTLKSFGGIDQGVSGLKKLGVRELNYRLIFMACSVQQANSSSTNKHASSQIVQDSGMIAVDPMDEENDIDGFSQSNAPGTAAHYHLSKLSASEKDEIRAMSKSSSIYSDLVNSFCPTVFGHNDIKRGLLLQLFSGVHKRAPDGIRLRGDINVCIVGDPSTAKSQFLKFVYHFWPRTVYTSGKASSAAGLTAAVVKDLETGNFTIEAGALLLADNSICCIDEFDKMDIRDEVAIHEAMEQQSISITKAGIQATLNARTSILAAANPVSGRYDTSKTLRANIRMPPPLMSRFDLFFVVLDRQDEATDNMIASHIVAMHQSRTVPIDPPFSKSQLFRYISYAKTLKPMLLPESQKLLVQNFLELRNNDSTGPHRSSYRITIRQLESLIRLCEALARLHLNPWVIPQYVTEATRLLSKSILTLAREDIDIGDIDLFENEAFQPLHDDDSTESDDDETFVPSSSDDDGDESPPTQKKTTNTKLSHDKYTRASSILIYQLKKHQIAHGTGLSQIKLIEWYLKNISTQHVSSLEQLAHESRLLRAIIHRMITIDRSILPMDTPSSQIDPNTSLFDQARERLNNRELVVHPNYVDWR